MTAKLLGVVVSEDALLMMCRNGTKAYTVTGPIPVSARFYTAHFCYRRNAFVLYFEHESFEPVPDGCEIPVSCECIVVDTRSQKQSLVKAAVDELPPTIEVMAEVALKLVWHVLKRDAGDEIAVNVLEYLRKHGWVEELT